MARIKEKYVTEFLKKKGKEKEKKKEEKEINSIFRVPWEVPLICIHLDRYQFVS